jgi:hypothetical protein
MEVGQGPNWGCNAKRKKKMIKKGENIRDSYCAVKIMCNGFIGRFSLSSQCV